MDPCLRTLSISPYFKRSMTPPFKTWGILLEQSFTAQIIWMPSLAAKRCYCMSSDRVIYTVVVCQSVPVYYYTVPHKKGSQTFVAVT